MPTSEITPLATIVHPTDFTAAGASAFAHAVAIALAAKSRLCLLHVREEHEAPPGRSEFRHLRDVLVAWGKLDKDAPPASIESALGLRVSSVSVPAKNARTGILEYLDDHPCDLVVLATHPAKSRSRWFDPSVERGILRKTRVVSLFLRDGARGFVDPATGDSRLRKVLIPIDGRLDWLSPVRRLQGRIKFIAPEVNYQLLYVGDNPPDALAEQARSLGLKIMVRTGPVVETILDVARIQNFDLLAMPTAGRHGLLDALRGSTTASVLDDARWPLLTLPVIGATQADGQAEDELARAGT
ncbi:MAG: universal stress protein [Roseiarcus sp.]|jgi:nucleotide-binding universal stress UspA family protein